MPSPVMHTAVGFTVFTGFRHVLGKKTCTRYFGATWLFLLTCLFLSLLPDIDAAVGVALKNMRAYHNQGTHSLVTGLLISLIAATTASTLRKGTGRAWFWLFFINYSLHVLLDTLCKGRGVMLFWPISDHRFLSPAILFVGVQWSEGLWSWHHVETFFSELASAMVLLIPCWLLLRFDAKSCKNSLMTKG